MTALVAAFCGTPALVLLSPYALIWVGALRKEDWDRLSAIGQTYGAASAVLSALALAGVAISLVVQSREGRAAQQTSVREFHRELIAMTSLDPERYLLLGLDPRRRRHRGRRTNDPHCLATAPASY